jgi:hypothetical protein
MRSMDVVSIAVKEELAPAMSTVLSKPTRRMYHSDTDESEGSILIDWQ